MLATRFRIIRDFPDPLSPKRISPIFSSDSGERRLRSRLPIRVCTWLSTKPAVDADLLARAYIDTLAKVEGVKHRSMLHRAPEHDPVAEMLSDLEGEPFEASPQLRVDLVAAAVLTARAIAAEPGLARRLRREAPIVTIATHTADLAPLVTAIVEECATADHQRKIILGRDGTETGPSRVRRAIRSSWWP